MTKTEFTHYARARRVNDPSAANILPYYAPFQVEFAPSGLNPDNGLKADSNLVGELVRMGITPVPLRSLPEGESESEIKDCLEAALSGEAVRSATHDVFRLLKKHSLEQAGNFSHWDKRWMYDLTNEHAKRCVTVVNVRTSTSRGFNSQVLCESLRSEADFFGFLFNEFKLTQVTTSNGMDNYTSVILHRPAMSIHLNMELVWPYWM